ncbi:MAG: MBL fold metallo-hydrolase [Candidatus Nanopelagicales bacterium]
MTGFVAMPGSTGPWSGGTFDGAQCVLAGNPGPMTLDGTNTWLLDADADSVVLVDPGPDDPAHLAAVQAALDGRRVRQIVLTHGHLDHSAGAGLFKQTFGAQVRALDPQPGHERLAPGEVVVAGDLEVHIVATPGHTSDSVSLHLPQRAAVLTGDTILGRGTTVVAHPDGRLADYLASLQLLQELVEAAGATAGLAGTRARPSGRGRGSGRLPGAPPRAARGGAGGARRTRRTDAPRSGRAGLRRRSADSVAGRGTQCPGAVGVPGPSPRSVSIPGIGEHAGRPKPARGANGCPERSRIGPGQTPPAASTRPCRQPPPPA